MDAAAGTLVSRCSADLALDFQLLLLTPWTSFSLAFVLLPPCRDVSGTLQQLSVCRCGEGGGCELHSCV